MENLNEKKTYKKYVPWINTKQYKKFFGYTPPVFKVVTYTPKNRDDNSINPNWKAAAELSGLIRYMDDSHGDSFYDWELLPKTIRKYITTLDIEKQVNSYDIKLGFFKYSKTNEKIQDINCLKLENIAKVHPNSNIFTMVLTFPEDFLIDNYINFTLPMISRIVYDRLCLDNGFYRNDWEMQTSFHKNTKYYHVHFRMYQNENTPEKYLIKRFTFKKQSIINVRRDVFKFFMNNKRIFQEFFYSSNLTYKMNYSYVDRQTADFKLSSSVLTILGELEKHKRNQEADIDNINNNFNAIIQNIFASNTKIYEKYQSYIDRIYNKVNGINVDNILNGKAKLNTLYESLIQEINDIYIESVHHWIVNNIDNKNVFNWIEQTKKNKALKVDDILNQLNKQDVNLTSEYQQFLNQQKERDTKFYNRAFSKTATFNDISMWNPLSFKFFKSGLAQIGKLLRDDFFVNTTKIDILMNRFEKEVNTFMEFVEYIENVQQIKQLDYSKEK